MKLFKLLAIVTCLLIGFTFVLPSAMADQWNKKTIVTFPEPVEVPGGVILPAGKYVFSLLESNGYRHIVRITNEDGTKVFATILALNNVRLQPTGETVLKFEERPRNTPEALHAWFYPGDHFGQEFVYPKGRAFRLATESKTPVLAMPEGPVPLEKAPVVVITPEQKEEPLETVLQAPPEKKLPQTASNFPQIALVLLLVLTMAVALRIASVAMQRAANR
ncbi:MAG: hypothetical protein LAP21_24385 [Acidobacteriia bacterium]|nr:hypothetical protein [Terriglobia bacterium]